MNRDDIIAMAQEAIILHSNDNPFDFQLKTVAQLERFAALVAAAEREACAQACEDVAAWTEGAYVAGCTDCAAAIRVRGEP